jgi:hypothetical protein
MFLLNVSFNTFDGLNDHLRDPVMKRLFRNDENSIKRQFKGTGSPDEYFLKIESVLYVHAHLFLKYFRMPDWREKYI